MHRIKLLLGLLLISFSIVYLLFGWIAYADRSAEFLDILVCFVFGSLHVVAGGLFLMNGMRERKREVERIDLVIRHLVKTNAGRVAVADLAMFAEITEDDARDYLHRRSQNDVSTILAGSGRGDVYFFGQQFWNN
ncbi:MAG: hypothetical protein HQ472_07765 [Ignavibacteria bacterium]|nr:hypothetical protein [Ignavibacteria bacterium]